MRSILYCVIAVFVEAAYCASIVGEIAGDKRLFIEVDITPATFSEAFVVLHVDGQHAGVMCPNYHPIDCFASLGPGDSRVTNASAYISVDTSVPATAWNRASHMVYASIESHFGQHLAFASAHVSSVGTDSTMIQSSIISADQGDLDNTRIMNIVIFSKDRPSQLDLLTRSLKRSVSVMSKLVLFVGSAMLPRDSG
jgi:hypothetical protein